MMIVIGEYIGEAVEASKMVITGSRLRQECYQEINQVSVAHLYDH